MEPYKTPDEIAEHFAVCAVTVARWRRAGMPALPLGMQYRYRVSEVEGWLRGRAVAAEGSVGQAAVVPLHERRSA